MAQIRVSAVFFDREEGGREAQRVVSATGNENIRRCPSVARDLAGVFPRLQRQDQQTPAGKKRQRNLGKLRAPCPTCGAVPVLLLLAQNIRGQSVPEDPSGTKGSTSGPSSSSSSVGGNGGEGDADLFDMFGGPVEAASELGRKDEFLSSGRSAEADGNKDAGFDRHVGYATAFASLLEKQTDQAAPCPQCGESFWADSPDPSSGLPMNSPRSGVTWNDISAFQMLLRTRVIQVGLCEVLEDPDFGTDVYPSTLVAWSTPAAVFASLREMFPGDFCFDKSDAPSQGSVSSEGCVSEAPVVGDLEELSGDMFECPPDWSLAHCVSVDLNMGKGIATVFKERFGRVSELKGQQVGVGGVAVIDLDRRSGGASAPAVDGCFGYYLVTKRKYHGKPTYDTLRASLVAMRDHAIHHGVHVIAMPRLGCGLDRLQWDRVRPILAHVFSGTGIALRVFTLPPRAEEAALLAQWPSRRRNHKGSSAGAGADLAQCRSCQTGFEATDPRWQCTACGDFALCRNCAEGEFGAMHASHDGHDLEQTGG